MKSLHCQIWLTKNFVWSMRTTGNYIVITLSSYNSIILLKYFAILNVLLSTKCTQFRKTTEHNNAAEWWCGRLQRVINMRRGTNTSTAASKEKKKRMLLIAGNIKNQRILRFVLHYVQKTICSWIEPYLFFTEVISRWLLIKQSSWKARVLIWHNLDNRMTPLHQGSRFHRSN